MLICRGQAAWVVRAYPNLDLYEQSCVFDGVAGLARFKIQAKHFNFYSRVYAPVYKFAAGPTSDKMRAYMEMAFDEQGLDVIPPTAGGQPT